MKLITNNFYLQTLAFSSFVEQKSFLDRCTTANRLNISTSYGDSHYCYVGCHSLTSEVLFVISFSTYLKSDALYFTSIGKCIVMNTDAELYYVNMDMKIEHVVGLSTPIVGLYQLDHGRLLLLSEADVRLLGSTGHEIRSLNLPDMIDEFAVVNSALQVRVAQQVYMFDLE